MNAFHVFAAGGVDFDAVAVLDEGGHLDFGTGFDGGGFGDVGGGVSAGGGFGVGDFQDDLLWGRHADELSVPEEERDGGTFLEPAHVVGDDGGGEAVLFEGGVIHEDVVFAITEGVDTFVAMDVGGFERVAVAVGFFEEGTAEQIAEFGAVEGLTLPGLYEVAFEHFVGFIVDLNLDAFFEFSGRNCTHLHWLLDEQTGQVKLVSAGHCPALFVRAATGTVEQIKAHGVDRTGDLLEAFEKHPEFSRTEKVRIDMLRRFGYYSTESNGHLSEYVAWYRKRPDEIRDWIDLGSWINGETGGYLRVCTEGRNWFETEFPQWMKDPARPYTAEKRSEEHGSYIIEGLETGRLYRGHFNVVNNGTITNLPDDAIVEVPGYVDAHGVNIPKVGDLPLGCAAICNASITVQRMSVLAAVNGDDTLLRQAMMMDPLVGAVCNPPEIWQMVDELLVEQAQWLPQYGKAIALAKTRLDEGMAAGTLIATKVGYEGSARLKIKTVDEMRADRKAANKNAGETDKAKERPAE